MLPFARFRVFLILAGSAIAAVAQVRLNVSPTTATLRVGNEQQFSVSVAGSTENAVTWSVGGVVGGNATVGTISTGRYLPPAAVPAPNTVTVTVTHRATGTFVDIPVTILNPYPMLASVLPAHIHTGPFALTVNGSGFVNGAKVTMGNLAVTTTYVSATRLIVAGTLDASARGALDLSVTNPDPGWVSSAAALRVELNPNESWSPRVTAGAAARFLEQTAFGPDRASITEVQRLGLEEWIEAQFSEPASSYQNPEMINTSLAPVQARFFTNAVHGRDQLRQRVAFALGQIWVVSGSVVSRPDRLVPYLRILQKNAFGNYRDLMRDVTLSPAMGDYLNLVNNVKGDAARGIRPNENYARELMQLFTIGTEAINPDGTYVLDAAGARVPAYTQTDIQEFARALTGWTYPTAPGGRPAARNPARYDGPMVAWEPNHDSGAKKLLGSMVLPANQTAAADLEGVLDNLFYHPNIGPFVCRNLIQHLVKSNPTPDYLKRVVDAFNNTGGVRGDMRAVIRAILLDPEARWRDSDAQLSATEGHLREPVVWIASLLRALGALVNDTNGLASRGAALGQNIFYPPTVFNYYMPGHRLPGSQLLAPEFQILSPATALERANLVNTLIYGSLGAGVVVIPENYTTRALSPNDLLDEVDLVLFHGQMPPDMRRIILQAVIETSGEKAKAQAALYLAASSGYYAVQQ
jgi:uncharacterized protein (DUF1800 family)